MSIDFWYRIILKMIKLVMLCHLTKHIHKIVSDSESVRGILYMYDRALEN